MNSPYPYTTPFGCLLIREWIRNSLSQALFSQRVECPPGWVQQIRAGIKAAPLPRMPTWAAVLGLCGEVRESFYDLAVITTADADDQWRLYRRHWPDLDLAPQRQRSKRYA